MKDRNFFSVTGDAAGNIWVNDALRFTAGHTGIRLLELGEIVPLGNDPWDDALKFSGVRRLRVTVPLVDGRNCREDAIDINNHCEDLRVEVAKLYPGKTYAGTLKGNSKRVDVAVEEQIGHGGETDWDFGNWSDQGNGDCGPFTLRARTADGSAVAVRVLNSPKPALDGPSFKWSFPSPNAWYHGIVVAVLSWLRGII
jgi:hypothetical protein